MVCVLAGINQPQTTLTGHYHMVPLHPLQLVQLLAKEVQVRFRWSRLFVLEFLGKPWFDGAEGRLWERRRHLDKYWRMNHLEVQEGYFARNLTSVSFLFFLLAPVAPNCCSPWCCRGWISTIETGTASSLTSLLSVFGYKIETKKNCYSDMKTKLGWVKGDNFENLFNLE